MARILYIEDDESTRRGSEIMLKKTGHDVIAREDAENAFALAEIWKPALIITDHDLGEGKQKGLQLALRLKEAKYNVVMMSGNNDALSGAKRADIPFFMKPCRIKDLLAEVGDLL